MAQTTSDLLADAQAGNRRALARLLTLVERGGEEARQISAEVFSAAKGWTYGITGAPGAGKSTLTAALVAEMRKSSRPVAVVAVDPSSPFSGGAILGDRVRMQAHTLDEGVYIRSMATRGHLGGLTVAVPDSIRLLQACGYEETIIETVGVGQVEVEIASEADTTVVVVNPGWGDAVQASKAGLMEIADVFVVNKADRVGAKSTIHDLENMLALAGEREWSPPIISCIATDGTGVRAVREAIEAHRAATHGSASHHQRRVDRLERETRRIVEGSAKRRLQAAVAGPEGKQLLAKLYSGDIDPWIAADQLRQLDK